MTILTWLIFLGAAVFEVGSDATVRFGLRGNRFWIVAAGCAMLGCYGLVVNLIKWDFSRLLGTYIAVFAVVSVLWGRFIFGENVPASVWMGLVLVVTGGLVIQFGR